MSYKDNDDVEVNIFMDDPVIQSDTNVEGDIEINVDAETESVNVFDPDYNIPQYADNYYYPNQLAQAYVIPQIYKGGYTPKEALQKGTYFSELYKPYKW